ncbi:MAG: energy transducer TonB [Bacteroidota bacterium]|nr:energy transducer TonB [Bacteroidota bacterium]
MKNKTILLLFLFCSASVFAQIQHMVDVYPTNVGGRPEFKRVFEQELRYPEKALLNKTGGKVMISFSVRNDSTIRDLKLVSSGSPELDKEALRLFKLYRWVPAIKEGEFVNGGHNVTFHFEPDKYKKICKSRGFVNPVYVQEKVDTTSTICAFPDQIPMYDKGMYALQDFIKSNLEYPRQAQLANIQGTVVLSFIVEPSGYITNIGVEKSVAGGCDQEAIRVLQLIKWYPAKKNDQLVRAKASYPFYFILNEDFKDNAAGEQK